MPVDRSAIDGQLRDIGEGERWWEEREFRDLPYILNPDERIQGIVNGKLFGPPRPRVLPAAHWLIVATNQRLICLKRERVGRQQVDIHLGQIIRMQPKGRLRGVQITLDTPQRRYRIRVRKADAFRFIGALAPLMQRAVAGAEAPAGLLPPGSAPVEGRLSRLLSRVSSHPAPEFVTRDELARLDSAVERLENDVERMRQHVEFLENLLQKQSESAFSMPGRSADS